MNHLKSIRSRLNHGIVLTAAMLLVALAYYLSYLRYGMTISDEGINFESAKRMMAGKEWWIDFYGPYGPMKFWPLAKLFLITGVSWSAYRLFYMGIRLVGLAFMMAVGKRLLPPRWSAVAVLPAIFAPGHLFKSEHLLWPMLFIWLMFRSWESRKIYLPLLVGAVAGFSFSIRPEILVPYIALSFAGLEAGRVCSVEPFPGKWRRRGMLAVGIIAALAFIGMFFPGTIPAAVSFGKFIIGGFKLDISSPAPGLSAFKGGADQVAEFFIFWCMIAVYAVYALDLLRALPKARGNIAWGYSAMVFATGCGIVYSAIYQSNSGHMLQVAAPAYILLVDLVYRAIVFGRHRLLKISAGGILFVSFAAFIFYAMCLAKISAVGGLSQRWFNNVRISTEIGPIYYQPSQAKAIQELINYIETHTAPDDDVIALPELFLLPTLAGRQSTCIMIPITPIYLTYLGKGAPERFYDSILQAKMLIYHERPVRFSMPRLPSQRLRNFYPELFNKILDNYTIENRIGDYIILRKGPDPRGATRNFIDGWDAFQYKDYPRADTLLNKALELGAPANLVMPLLENIKQASGTPVQGDQ